MKNRIFGRIGSNLFVLLFSMTLALSLSISNAIGAVYDDFNGSEINSTLWSINDPCHILSQSGGFFHAIGPPSFCSSGLTSTRAYSGDFEFVLEYTDFKSTSTIDGNRPQISLQVTSFEGFIQIFRAYNSQNDFIWSSGVVNGAMTEGFYANASSPAGSLKISRIGSAITTYYKEGGGWLQLGSFEGAFTGEVGITISAYTGDNGNFYVSCDKVYASDQGSTTCQQQLQDLQDQVSTLTSQNQTLTQQNGQLQTQVNAVNSGLSNIQQTLTQVFSNPQFTIPGATPLEQYQNLVNAILGLNRGRLEGIYMNLGGK